MMNRTQLHIERMELNSALNNTTLCLCDTQQILRAGTNKDLCQHCKAHYFNGRYAFCYKVKYCQCYGSLQP